MRKIIAAINMTLDGVCDHTAVTADDELHNHYTEIIRNSDEILYGRITYQLMEYWRPFIDNPSDEKSMNDFASAINNIQKIVFSHTLKRVDWSSATLATQPLKETALELKQKPGKDVLVGSPSLIIELLNLNILNELQICVHPVIAGPGQHLFKNISDRTLLKLVRTKTLSGGAVIFYYEPVKK